MRITGYSTSIISRLRPTSAAGTPTQSRRGNSDTVSLSPAGQLYMKAEQSLRELPSVREGRVREFQGQLATGGYHVNAESVASAMLADATALEGKAGGDE